VNHFPNKQTSGDRSLVLLAPAGACLKPFSGPLTYSRRVHAGLLREIQRLRGEIYLREGAIQASQLSHLGHHVSPCDDESWHLLTVRPDGRVVGCIRFLRHPNTVSCHQLRVCEAPLAHSRDWAGGFVSSINAELEAARRFNFSYVEIGGWALAEELRGTAEALYTVLSTYALAQLQGGALGITTATERNGSASILRRLGGRQLEWDGVALPPYYDPAYRCGMEVLRFDSRCPSARYASTVNKLRSQIATLPVFCPGEAPAVDRPARPFSHVVPGFASATDGVPALLRRSFSYTQGLHE
jgi:hypothetical protein